MLKDKKILIVENSSTIRLQIKMMLESEGALLIDVGTGWGMSTKLEEYGVIADLIIMDLILNSEDGLDLIKTLKENIKFENDRDQRKAARGLVATLRNYITDKFH